MRSLQKAKSDVIERKKMERTDALAQIAKKWPKLTTTKSGLMFEVLKQGQGGSPSPTSQVSVNYTARCWTARSLTARRAGESPRHSR